MSPRTVPQLQRAITQLDHAIENHEQWYKALLRALIAHVPPDPSDLLPDAHRRCSFGQWLTSGETKGLRDHPAYAALVEAHQQMHHDATHLLDRVVNRSPVADTEFDQFSASLDLMRMQLHSLRRELSDALEHRDPLTGVRNRTNMLADLREQQALVARGVLPCSIAILDLDHFKEINDRHGHPTGDVVLESVAMCLDANVRPYDRIYRYGGEEFLLCMPSTTLDGAVELVERLREAIASHDPGAAPDGQPLRITASFGVTAMARDRKVEESIDRADRALYQAKASGRNRVVSGG